MSLALLFHYLMLNVFRMLIHPSSGACDLFVELFHGLYCSGSMCVGVTLWFGYGGVVSVSRLRPQNLTSAGPSGNECIAYILKCIYVVICCEIYTTLHTDHISFGFCNATISVAIADRVFETYEANYTVVCTVFTKGLFYNVNNISAVFFFFGRRCTYGFLLDIKLFHLSAPFCSLLHFRRELAYNCESIRR